MILISAVGFGSYGVWSRFIGAKFGLFFQGWVRSGLVLLVLIPIALFTKSLRPINKKDAKWLLVPIIFGIFTQAPIYYAFNNMDIGTATLIFYASFLVATYLIGSIFIKEKMTRVKIISLFLGFLGLLFSFGIFFSFIQIYRNDFRNDVPAFFNTNYVAYSDIFSFNFI